MEWKLFDGDTHEFETREWYADREAAHHLEQSEHRERLLRVFEMSMTLSAVLPVKTISDLGCGDGGLLYLMQGNKDFKCWGYDLAPNNVKHAQDVRGVDVRYTDFKSDSTIEYGDLTIMSEVLEHLTNPHEVLRELPSDHIIISSPLNENDVDHYEFHLWAWDWEGFEALVEQAGYKVIYHENCNWSQIIVASRVELPRNL